MKYSDLDLKINKDTSTVIIMPNNKEIEVLHYLPVQDKIDLIQIALQKSEENGTYNEMKLDMYFHLYLVFMYSNLEFTEEEKADEYTLYDELQSNNVIISIIGGMGDNEYEDLIDSLETMKEAKNQYNNSAAAMLRTLIVDMPKNAAVAEEIVNNFDKTKYQNVIDFAKEANAGRSVT